MASISLLTHIGSYCPIPVPHEGAIHLPRPPDPQVPRYKPHQTFCLVPDNPLHKAICAGLSVSAPGFLDSSPRHRLVANAISTVSKRKAHIRLERGSGMSKMGTNEPSSLPHRLPLHTRPRLIRAYIFDGSFQQMPLC